MTKPNITGIITQAKRFERERIINLIQADVQLHHQRGLDASAEYLINLISRIKGEKNEQ